MSVAVHAGDCSDVIRTLADSSIDSVVTDPPYALISMSKRFGKVGRTDSTISKAHPYQRHARGFMNKQWDNGTVAFDPAFWAEVLRVLKPGGHVVAFGGTRTYHRLACAIEDAGFEIRDQIGWLYGAGFPKSHSVTKGLGDGRCRCEPQTERGMRPVRQPNVSASVHATAERGEVLFASVSEQGSPRAMLRPEPEESGNGRKKQSMEGRRDLPQASRQLRERAVRAVSAGISEHEPQGRLCDGTPLGDGDMGEAPTHAHGDSPPHRPQAAEQCADKSGTVAGQSEPQARGAWPLCRECGKPMVPDGLGTALKPAWEPIVLARKALIGTVAENVTEHGTGAINIDGCRVAVGEADLRDVGRQINRNVRTPDGYGFNSDSAESGVVVVKPEGRWPANVIHDGSDEVIAAFPDNLQSGTGAVKNASGAGYKPNALGSQSRAPGTPNIEYGDIGSAARFFYSSKADAGDRLGSKHPTVKPVDLMAYLCRLITPPGGTVLDPFAGSGTTGMAAMREGFNAILIERETEYVADIRARIAHVQGGDTPLFAITP